MNRIPFFLALIAAAVCTNALGQTTALSTPTPPATLVTSLSPATPEKAVAPDASDRSIRVAKKDAPAVITRFDKPPVIDGVLNDPQWQTATVFTDFLQTQPGDNVKPSDPTEAMIGYDSKYLYIAFHAKQERSKIRATQGRRDNVFSDDFVVV